MSILRSDRGVDVNGLRLHVLIIPVPPTGSPEEKVPISATEGPGRLPRTLVRDGFARGSAAAGATHTPQSPLVRRVTPVTCA